MDKNTVPQDYTLGLALFDSVPVILFGWACLELWRLTGSILVLIGGIICFTAGMLKVLWKIIVVIRKKNVWPLFVQMRIGMPAGFTLLLIGVVAACITKDLSAVGSALLHPIPVICLILYGVGIAAMIICGKKLDSADLRANWIEQSCNTVAQGAFLAAMLAIRSIMR